VTLVDDLSRGKHDRAMKELLSRPAVRLIRCDLTDVRQMNQLGGPYDHVYHLAAVNGTANFYDVPHEVLRINTKSLINVLEWFIAHNMKGKILFTSSNEAYAAGLDSFGTLPLPTPEDVPMVIPDSDNPRWTYAASKLIGELFLSHYAKRYGFRMSIVRPHNFYGPRAGYGHVIPELIARATRKEDPFVVFGSDQTRSFCYIDDAVEAMKSVMESRATDGETFHIGSNVETRIADLADMIFTQMRWRPRNLVRKSALVGSVQRRLPDVRKIRRTVGWKPRTSLYAGLEKSVGWYTNPANE
jgi:nucleoside-diphosphate-sugar epimerase